MADYAPFEIMTAPLSIYSAAVGTTMTVINAAPSGSYTLLGTSGPKNYGEDGVKISSQQTLNQVRTLGMTGARKVFRSEEDISLEATLIDMTLANYAALLNFNTVSATGGSPAYNTLPLMQGTDVVQKALLVRGDYSPYAAAMKLQYFLLSAYQSGPVEPTFAKNGAAAMKFTFMALQDPTNGFGSLVAQTGA